jgi:protein CWC15
MTTAHRPTYNPTKGGNIQGGNKLYYPTQQYSSKDLPSNLQIKTRRPGQGTIKEVNRRDFKQELLQRERKGKMGISGLVSSLYADENESNFTNNFNHESFISSKVDMTSDLLQLDAPIKKQRLDSVSGISEINSKPQQEVDNVFLQDKDLSFGEDSENDENFSKLKNRKSSISEGESSNSKSEEERSEDSDDEEQLLLKELEKIKKEREEESKRKEQEKNELLKIQTQEQILKGNPLMNTTDYSLKKKWYEDTVFKNQAKNEPKIKKRFINDTVRSDFHRKFLAKTIQ